MVSTGGAPRGADARARNTTTVAEVERTIGAWRADVGAWRVFVESMTPRAEHGALDVLSAIVREHEGRVDRVLVSHLDGRATLDDVAAVVADARGTIATLRTIAAEGT